MYRKVLLEFKSRAWSFNRCLSRLQTMDGRRSSMKKFQKAKSMLIIAIIAHSNSKESTLGIRHDWNLGSSIVHFNSSDSWY